MAREMILIPKLKYEELLKNETREMVNERVNDSSEKDKVYNIKTDPPKKEPMRNLERDPLIQEHTSENTENNANETNQIGKGASYVKMTPASFLNMKQLNKNTAKSVKPKEKRITPIQKTELKKKWMTFKL